MEEKGNSKETFKALVVACASIGGAIYMKPIELIGEPTLVILIAFSLLIASLIYFEQSVESFSLKEGQVVLRQLDRKKQEIDALNKNFAALTIEMVQLVEEVTSTAIGWSGGFEEIEEAYTQRKARVLENCEKILAD